MSFYLEDDDGDPRYSLGGALPSSQKTNDDYSEGGTDHFVCDNCGSTDCYLDETSGGLVCVECHTQSQTIIAASQTELEYDDTMMLAGRVSGGYLKTAALSGTTRKRTRKRLGELDQSTPLPTAEQCIIGFQRILKDACRQVAASFMKDCPRLVRRAAMQHCRMIWKGYLDAWMEGADFYGRLYPEIRFSFRDAFLTPSLRLKVLRTLTHNASKQVRAEVGASEDSRPDSNTTRMVASTDATLASVKDDVGAPPDDTGDDIAAVPFEFIHGDDNSDPGHSNATGFRPEDSIGANDTNKDSKEPLRRKRSHRQSPIHLMIHRHQNLIKINTLGRKATALLMSPSMDMAAAIVAMAFCPFGVTCQTIRQLILEGSVSLLHAFPLLTPLERKQLKLIRPFFRMNEPPSVTALEKLVLGLQVASGYIPKSVVLMKKNPQGESSAVTEKVSGKLYTNTLRKFTPRALPVAMARAVAHLRLSQEALNYCFALMGLPICKDKNMNGRQSIEWLPKPLLRCRPDKVVGMAELAGVIVTASQFIPKWDEHWYIKTNDSVGIPWNENTARKLGPSAAESYLHFLENNYLVTENCLLLNDEERMTQLCATVKTLPEGSRVRVSQSDNTAVVPPSTLLRPFDIQPISCRPVKKRGSVAVQEGGTPFEYTAVVAPIGTFIEFVSMKLGTNPRLVLEFCHELSEEMRLRNQKRKERRNSTTPQGSAQRS